MQSQCLFLLCFFLIVTSPTWAMKFPLNNMVSLRNLPHYRRYTISAFMTNIPSAFKSLADKTTQFKQRSFEPVKPLVSTLKIVSLPLQADNEQIQIDFLCKALEEKIVKGKSSSVYPNLSEL